MLHRLSACYAAAATMTAAGQHARQHARQHSAAMSTNVPVKRVRELLRPFISIIHPDRHHGVESVATLNEDSLKRLNGFLDMADARSAPNNRSVARAGSCEPTYQFVFGGVESSTSKQQSQSKSQSHSQPQSKQIKVLVNIPAPLRSFSASEEWSQQWSQLAANCAVELLQKSDIVVPDALAVQQQEQQQQQNMSDLPGHLKKRKKKKAAVSPAEMVRDAVWASNITMELTRQSLDAEIEAVDFMEYDSSEDDNNDVGGGEWRQSRSGRWWRRRKRSSILDEEDPELVAKLQKSVVQRVFDSRRVSVAATAQDLKPHDVVHAAEALKCLLLEHYEKWQFGHPRWSCVLFVLDNQEKCHFTALRKEEGGSNDDVVLLTIPCHVMLGDCSDTRHDEVVEILYDLNVELMSF